MADSTINTIGAVIGWVATLAGWGVAVAAYFIGRGKREQVSEDADRQHTERIADLEERHTRHTLELGRLTDIAASLNTIIARQDEKINGLGRWMQAIDERVLHVERGKHGVRAGGGD